MQLAYRHDKRPGESYEALDRKKLIGFCFVCLFFLLASWQLFFFSVAADLALRLGPDSERSGIKVCKKYETICGLPCNWLTGMMNDLTRAMRCWKKNSSELQQSGYGDKGYTLRFRACHYVRFQANRADKTSSVQPCRPGLNATLPFFVFLVCCWCCFFVWLLLLSCFCLVLLLFLALRRPHRTHRSVDLVLHGDLAPSLHDGWHN